VTWAEQYRIAVIVPCHNEETAVAKVVGDLRRSLPGATIYVYDNASTDRTVERAALAGAVVRSEPVKGKGNVVRRAFADVDADVYLLIDGDDTYDASAAPAMVEKLVHENLDHVLGVRSEVRAADGSSAYRPAHELGNRVLNSLVRAIFGDTLGDMLSGYRVFSRRFVKSFPATSRGFEIETELTIHSLALRTPSAAVEVAFRDRAAGSESKLRTVRDGLRILNVIAGLTRHERPLAFFGVIAALAAVLAVALGGPLLLPEAEVPASPSFAALFVCSFLLLASVLSLVLGVVMDGLRRTRYEHSRLAYMRHPAVASATAHAQAHVPLTVGRSLPRPVLGPPEHAAYALPAQRTGLTATAT
jgi:hypothetical protein